MKREQQFLICDGKGFFLPLPNGWTVSVQFGPGNYCDNYDMPISDEGQRESGKRGSLLVEVAAWDANGDWYENPRGHGDEAYTVPVLGYQNIEQVWAFIKKVASFDQTAEVA